MPAVAFRDGRYLLLAGPGSAFISTDGSAQRAGELCLFRGGSDTELVTTASGFQMTFQTWAGTEFLYSSALTPGSVRTATEMIAHRCCTAHSTACVGDRCLTTWINNHLYASFSPGGDPTRPLGLWFINPRVSDITASADRFLPVFVYNNGTVDVVAATSVSVDGFVGKYFALASNASIDRLSSSWDGTRGLAIWSDGGRAIQARRFDLEGELPDPAPIPIGVGTLEDSASSPGGPSIVAYTRDGAVYIRLLDSSGGSVSLRSTRRR